MWFFITLFLVIIFFAFLFHTGILDTWCSGRYDDTSQWLAESWLKKRNQRIIAWLKRLNDAYVIVQWLGRIGNCLLCSLQAIYQSPLKMMPTPLCGILPCCLTGTCIAPVFLLFVGATFLFDPRILPFTLDTLTMRYWWQPERNLTLGAQLSWQGFSLGLWTGIAYIVALVFIGYCTDEEDEPLDLPVSIETEHLHKE
jgi:hypothetical protein